MLGNEMRAPRKVERRKGTIRGDKHAVNAFVTKEEYEILVGISERSNLSRSAVVRAMIRLHSGEGLVVTQSISVVVEKAKGG